MQHPAEHEPYPGFWLIVVVFFSAFVIFVTLVFRGAMHPREFVAGGLTRRRYLRVNEEHKG